MGYAKYINDDDLSNAEIKNEINNINNKYQDFYNFESKIFSKLNKKFIKNDSTLSKYSITIILTKNENYLFNNTFRVGCENYLLGILIIIAISSTIGTLLFGLLADIFGRKIIACTNKFGRIGDEVEITFKYPITPWRNGNTLFAIIGDFKNQNDKNPRCDEWGHIYGHQHCVVEFIVKDGAFNENRRIVDVFPSLKGNPVIKIQRSGVNFIDELSK